MDCVSPATINGFSRTRCQVRCPDCGSEAHCSYPSGQCHGYGVCPCQQLRRVECSSCDYLLVTCAETEAVVETFYIF